jgi:ABC-type glycerol-3-phosphate transport system substrate-binding protein
VKKLLACLCCLGLFTGCGQQSPVETSAPEITQPITEERAFNLLTKMGALFVTNPGTMQAANALGATRRSMFPKGNFLFQAMLVADLTTDEMREFEHEFGVLPLPKYDEEQKEYYTVVDGGSDILTVLKTAQQTEMIGALVEALSAESYKKLVPVYCEIALEQKGTRDKESVEMLRNILDSYGFTGWKLHTLAIDNRGTTLVED